MNNNVASDVPQMLDDLASPNNAARRQAEATLQRRLAVPGFYASLGHAVDIRSTLSQSQRFTAVSILKNYLKWVTVSNAEVASILPLLLDALWNEPHAPLGRSLASAIARMGSSLVEYSDTWSQLGMTIVGVLSNSSGVVVTPLQLRYAVSLCTELVVELPDEKVCELSTLIPVLWPIVEAAADGASGGSSSSSSTAVQALAAQFIVDVVQVVSSKDSEHVATFLQNSFPAYFGYSTLPISTTDAELNKRTSHCVTLVQKAIASFPSLVTSARLVDWFSALQRNAEVLREANHRSSSSTEGDDNNDEGDEPEDEETLRAWEQLISSQWHTVALMLKKKKIQNGVAAVIDRIPRHVVELILQSCISSRRDVQQLTGDPNLYLRQQEDRRDEISWLAKDVAAECAELCVTRVGQSFVDALRDAAAELLFGQSDPATDASAAESHEALLFLLTHLVEVQGDALRSAGLPLEGAGSVVEVIIQRDLAAGVPQIVATRGFAFLEGLCRWLREGRRVDAQRCSSHAAMCTMLVPPTLDTVARGYQSTPPSLLLVAACSLLQHAARYCDRQCFSPAVVSQGFQCLTHLLSSSSIEGETLHLVMECTEVWTKRSSCQPADWSAICPYLCQCLLNCWSRHVSDPNMGEYIVDVFQALLKDHSAPCEASLCSEVAWMSEILAGRSNLEGLCNTPHVVRLLAVMVRFGGPSLVQTIASQALQPLCFLLLRNQDSLTCSTASETLAALIRRAGPTCVDYNVLAPVSLLDFHPSSSSHRSASPSPPSTPPLLGVSTSSMPRSLSPMPQLDEPDVEVPLREVLVAIVRSLLRFDRRESSLLNVSKFLNVMAELPNMFSHAHVGAFVTAVVERLGKAKTCSVVGELLQPLAILAQQYPVEFIGLLDQQMLLEGVLTEWIASEPAFVDQREVLEVTLAGLLNLLERCPTNLQATMIRVGRWRDAKNPYRSQRGPNPGLLTPEQGTTFVRLPVAVFLGIGKTLCAFLSSSSNAPQRSSNSGQDDGEGFDEEDEEMGLGGAEDDGVDVAVDSDSDDDDDDLATDDEQAKRGRGGGGGGEQLAWRERCLAAFRRIAPLVLVYGAEATPFLSRTEIDTLMQFFA